MAFRRADRLYKGVPHTSIDTVYTVPEGAKVEAINLWMTNSTSALAKVKIHILVGEEEANNGNVFFFNVVPPNGNVELVVRQVLNPGDKVAVLQETANAVVLYISGLVVS